MDERDPIFRKSTCYRPVILHALKSFLYLTTKHASMERVQQYSVKKLNNATSKHFPIVLLINSFLLFSGQQCKVLFKERVLTSESVLKKQFEIPFSCIH